MTLQQKWNVYRARLLTKIWLISTRAFIRTVAVTGDRRQIIRNEATKGAINRSENQTGSFIDWIISERGGGGGYRA